ncbi:uncharacterized protein PRCAT00003572001 [Priceomyces carsonii]|uniref:uncharacterized protein n=1 Tax=Priceomyces carsonii TaxID=28549 RepID=UPI002EDA9AB8|nr:unnamed protein product [Priceomyces carsonii]
MSIQLITSEELKVFLDDVRKNIDSDDSTDFKRLILYLFSFTNHKLKNNDYEYLDDLFEVIELVVDRKKFLLNSMINKEDVKNVHVPPNLGSEEMMLYEWFFSLFLEHLSNPSLNNSVLNDLKCFIINVIKLVTSKLNEMRYINIIRQSLLEFSDNNLKYLFDNLGRSNKKSSSKLFANVHLYSILNDYDLSLKLHLFGYQVKIESYARKLWFLLNDPLSEMDLTIASNLKSILILSSTNYVCVNYTASWTQIALILDWLNDHIKTWNIKNNSVNLINCICHSLLSLLKLCLKRETLDNFINGIKFSQLFGISSRFLPHNILKTMHLINYTYQLSLKIKVEIGNLQSSNLNPLIVTPFEDSDLEFLRLELLDILHKSEIDQVSSLLEFINSEKSSPRNAGLNFDFSGWLSNVEKITEKDAKGQVLLKRCSLYTLISSLGTFPCLLNKDFDLETGECLRCGNCPMAKNFYESIASDRKLVLDSHLTSCYYKEIICNFFLGVRQEAITNDPILCCNLLLSIFKLFASYSPPMRTLESEPIFLFIFDQLANNKNRDVRLLCSRILPLYLIQSDDKLRENNFKFIFQNINCIDFSTENRKQFAESTIKCLVEISIIANGEWLCVLIIKLADLFGESNDQHVNYVFNAFLHIAAAKSLTPYKLLSPYLPSIAERIIKKPRMLSKITELLGVTKKYFLYRTREYTTPRFLEYYKHDFIQEIADSFNVSKWKLIAKSLPRIVATYLVKDDQIREDYILNVLGNASPEFKSVTMNDIISSVGEITWFIILQIQVNENGLILNEARIMNALAYVAKINMKQQEAGKLRMSRDDYVKYLLEEHVLELVQRFSENVHHIKGTRPYLEKVSSLRAITFLIEKHIKAVTTALGQISTCLQASLVNPEFELLAIKCWNSLIQNLPSEHLISLLDIIVSMIFQRFKYFENRTKEIAIEILRKIFNEINGRYNTYSLYYLSIPFIDQIQDYKPINTFKLMKPISKSKYFQEYTRRLNTNNRYVVQQALDDLHHFTTLYQLNCQKDFFKDALISDHISELIRALLETSSKFKNSNRKIATSSAKVLSILGSLDSNKFNFKTMKKRIIIIHDFYDRKENAEFLIDFIETKILNIFWASNDPVKQLFSAYAMQTFLQVLGLDSKVSEEHSENFARETWSKFSDIAKSTLTPLLSSKYVSPLSRYEPMEFPFYKVTMKYERWLTYFTSNLLKRPLASVVNNKSEDNTKEVILRTCAMLIRDQDITLCQYLLKYICLSHISNGSEDVCNDIKKEFLTILHIRASKSLPDRVELLKACYQSIFEVLDYINEWISAANQYLNDHHMSKSDNLKVRKNIDFCNNFLQSIPMDLIAIKSAECDSYERTIFYLEKCFRDGRADEFHNIDNINVITTLQSMYSNINDFDALNGILKSFSTNNLTEKLVTFQYNENWSLAQESFQVLGESGSEKDKINFNTKYLKSLSDCGLYNEVLSTLTSKVDFDDIESIPLEWSIVGLLASIVSADLSQMKKWLFVIDSIGQPLDVETSINYELAVGLKHAFSNDGDGFNHCVQKIYDIIGAALVPPISSSFSRNTFLMNQLHALYDLNLILQPYFDKNEVAKRKNEAILAARIGNIDQSFYTQWNVLAMHRVANTIIMNERKIADILLHSSSIARENNRLDISTRSIMKAMSLDDQEANIEYTELLWAQGKQTEAIKSLSEILNDDDFKDNRQKSKVQLQYAVWLDESNHSSSSTIISEYSKAFKIESSWEKPYYDLGKFYNKVMESKHDNSGYYEHQIIRHFLKALALGNSFIFEALPKLITIWLDFAQKKGHTKEAERRLNQIIIDVEKYVDNIQVYVWYTSITQILSRIVHSHEPSARLLSLVISKIIKSYPKHSLWYVLSHLNSNDNLRRERAKSILKTLLTSDSQFNSKFSNASDLFQNFIKIANFKIQKKSVRRMSLVGDFGLSLLTNPYDSLVIPVRSNLEIRLPASTTSKFSAFPKSASITFDGFDDNVNIFHSLQMPRQVTIRGSDLRPYRLMIKKDDTRKDAKVVEFTTMINRLLTASNEARKRNLFIANYSVIPLAENMGVIEFVPDVATMKSVVGEQRKAMGKVVNERKLFIKLDEAQKTLKNKKGSSNHDFMKDLVELFSNVCRNNPPVLHSWYIKQFPDPTVWYLARNSFTRSSAVMSIVGYIVGLGDRHCENILFLKKNGLVLHIDFDCLFEKGRTLPTPEIVPFRLTQNMVDAMGITGIEGTFRISCEVTGQLLRDNEAPLMNILETLLYDPLLDWKTHQNPQEHLRKVRRKIRGLISEKEELPMNINGQVDILIQEAASVENLCQMYGGWAPYI